MGKESMYFYSKTIALISITFLGVFGVYIGLGLYADGSYFLLTILKSHQFFDFYTARRFVQLITQAPVVFAVKWGVNDLNQLIYCHSAGVVLIPLAFWIAALIKQFKTDLFWFFIMAFCVSYLNTGLFAIGEYNLTYAMVAFCASLLMQPTPIKIVDCFFLITTALFLILSYESMLFLGPLLCYVSLKRLPINKHLYSKKVRRFVKTSLILASLLFIISAETAFISILFPRDPSGLFGSLSNILLMLGSTQFIYLLLMVVLIVNTSRVKQRGFIALACLLSIAHGINYHFWNSPQMNYDFRAFAGVLLAAILFIIAGYYFHSIQKAPARTLPINASNRSFDLQKMIEYPIRICEKNKLIRRYLLIYRGFFTSPTPVYENPLLIACFLSMIIPFYIQLIDFSLWARDYERFISTHRGFIGIEQTKLAQHRFYWQWTNPSLSLLFRGNQEGAMLINDSQYNGWQPFEPKTMELSFLQDYYKNKPLYSFTLQDNGAIRRLYK